jgi:hypothetical protein
VEDLEFLSAFHDGSLPSDEIRHRGHLRLAWLILNRHPVDEAATIVTREIRRFAISQGAASRYHDTLTRFWVRLVSHATNDAADAKNIDELMEKFPFLCDKNLPYRHWKRETFDSDGARAGWVEPDIAPLP